MNIAQKFNEHPATVGETYGQHFLMAMGFSLAMLRAAFCCALHAVFPFLCEKSGSRCIEGLYERMVTNRSRLAERQASDAVEA
jgi:hypothetical protein